MGGFHFTERRIWQAVLVTVFAGIPLMYICIANQTHLLTYRFLQEKNRVFGVNNPLTNGSEDSFIRSQYKDSCSCHSMFTIGSCGMNHLASLKPKDAVWLTSLEGLHQARTRQDTLMFPYLQALSRYLPPLFAFNATKVKNNSDLAVKASKFLSRSSQSLPFLNCQVHVYSPSEVLTCTRKYYENTGKPLRIAFVGDSRVRNTMQQMIRSTHHKMHYRLQGTSEDVEITMAFLDQKAKFNIPVQSLGIELRLHWSAYLEMSRDSDNPSEQGARDLLETWVYGNTNDTDDGPIPDVIYITTGLWGTSMLSEDHAVASFIRTMEQMAPLLKALAEKTQVLWHIHGPIKEWLATRDIPNGAIDMMNRASWKWLHDSNVWLWDSRTVLMLKQHGECHRIYKAALHKLVPEEWGCNDFQHAGHDVEDAAANMIWNFVCNPVLEFSTEHCCS